MIVLGITSYIFDEDVKMATIQHETLSSDRLMTTAEVMRLLNLSRTKIWTMVQKDGLPAFKFGGDYRYRESEILKWMEQFRVQNTKTDTNTNGNQQ